MYYKHRKDIFVQYNTARGYFVKNPQELIAMEEFVSQFITNIINHHYDEFLTDYNEANYLHPFWMNYPPENRGRAPIGDQIPWIEVGEHAVGHKLNRLVAQYYDILEVGLPSGADNRFIMRSNEIANISNGFTDSAFVFLDIKSVGPRDNCSHTVISPYQVSGDGIWIDMTEGMINSSIIANGQNAAHVFYPAISPIYVLSTLLIAPTIHIFVKPIYTMLSIYEKNNGETGQPLDAIKVITVPNGLLLTQNPAYLNKYPRLFFPGKDDKNKPAMKVRCRVSFDILSKIGRWRVEEIK